MNTTLTLPQFYALARLFNAVGKTYTVAELRKEIAKQSLVALHFDLEEIDREVSENNEALELEALEIA